MLMTTPGRCDDVRASMATKRRIASQSLLWLSEELCPGDDKLMDARV